MSLRLFCFMLIFIIIYKDRSVLKMTDKLFYSYDGDETTLGYVPGSMLNAYYGSAIFDEYNRLIWYRGMPYGTSYPGANRSETFNDYDNNSPLGTYSATFGTHTQAYNPNEFAIGKYNVSYPDESIFEIGIGRADDDRENAMWMAKDGTTYLPHELYSYVTYSYVEADPAEGDEGFVTVQDLLYGIVEHGEYYAPVLGINAECTGDNISDVKFVNSTEYYKDIAYFVVPAGTTMKLNANLRVGYLAETLDGTGNGLGCASKLYDISATAFGNTITYTQINGYSGLVPYKNAYYMGLFDLSYGYPVFAYGGKEIPENTVSSYFAYGQDSIYTTDYTYNYPSTATSYEDSIDFVSIDKAFFDTLSQIYYGIFIRRNRFVKDSGEGETSKSHTQSKELNYPHAYILPRYPVMYTDQTGVYSEVMSADYEDAEMLYIPYLSKDGFEVAITNETNYIYVAMPAIYDINDFNILYTNDVEHTEYNFAIDTVQITQVTLYAFGTNYNVYILKNHNNLNYTSGKLRFVPNI